MEKVNQFLVCVFKPHETDATMIQVDPLRRLSGDVKEEDVKDVVNEVQSTYGFSKERICCIHPSDISESSWNWLVHELRESNPKKQYFPLRRDEVRYVT